MARDSWLPFSISLSFLYEVNTPFFHCNVVVLMIFCPWGWVLRYGFSLQSHLDPMSELIFTHESPGRQRSIEQLWPHLSYHRLPMAPTNEQTKLRCLVSAFRVLQSLGPNLISPSPPYPCNWGLVRVHSLLPLTGWRSAMGTDNILFLQMQKVISISEHKAVGSCFREVTMEAARVLLVKARFLLVLPLWSQCLPWRSLSINFLAAYCFWWFLGVSFPLCTLFRQLTLSQE